MEIMAHNSLLNTLKWDLTYHNFLDVFGEELLQRVSEVGLEDHVLSERESQHK